MAQVNLSELAKAGGGTRRALQAEPAAEASAPLPRKPEPGAAEPRFPITLTQQPQNVRQQLMMMKAETGKTIENLMAEAINDLFAKYGKAEIAIIKSKKGRTA